MFIRKNHIVKINLPGGIVAAGLLYSILNAAEKSKVTDVFFGTRQQMFLKVNDGKLAVLEEALSKLEIVFETDADHKKNIVSSYVTEGVFQSGNWLSEGVYKDVLDLFNFTPRLKINLVDNAQTFIPFFTGNLNFISSGMSNYWYLYIRFQKTNSMYLWPVLIYTNDIPRISQLIENAILNNTYYEKDNFNGDALYNGVQAEGNFITQPITEQLDLPEFTLPYYEGFNRYENKLWLGIYRRDEIFPVSFLKDLCAVCLQTKVGQLYTTPWKSIIINGIQEKDRKLWDYVLGKHRINVRHAANELNWQVEDLSEEGLNLKRYLIRQFDKVDVRTYGLCFGIKTEPQSGLWGSVIIQKQAVTASKRKDMERYDILYTKNFNPNLKEYILFRKDVDKENLVTYLLSLCKYYYNLKHEEELIPQHAYRHGVFEDAPTKQPPPVMIHQCSQCFTVYDEAFGDETGNIAPGTPFSELSNSYTCPVCEASKKFFVPVDKKSLVQLQ